MSLAILKKKIQAKKNLSHKKPNFSINNIRNTHGVLSNIIRSQQNPSLGCNNITHCCCSDINNIAVKKSTKSTRGYLTTKYYILTRNTKNMDQKSQFINKTQTDNINNISQKIINCEGNDCKNKINTTDCVPLCKPNYVNHCINSMTTQEYIKKLKC